MKYLRNSVIVYILIFFLPYFANAFSYDDFFDFYRTSLLRPDFVNDELDSILSTNNFIPNIEKIENMVFDFTKEEKTEIFNYYKMNYKRLYEGKYYGNYALNLFECGEHAEAITLICMNILGYGLTITGAALCLMPVLTIIPMLQMSSVGDDYFQRYYISSSIVLGTGFVLAITATILKNIWVEKYIKKQNIILKKVLGLEENSNTSVIPYVNLFEKKGGVILTIRV